jgi:hypothetical protein
VEGERKMNVNDFNGTIPDGRLDPPDEPDWGKDMEQEKSCDGCRWGAYGIDEMPCCDCKRPARNWEDHYELPIFTPSPEGEQGGELDEQKGEK